MENDHKILLHGNAGVKSIIIKKKYLCQIKFERASVNLNIKGLQLVLNEMIFVQLVCLHGVLT